MCVGEWGGGGVGVAWVVEQGNVGLPVSIIIYDVVSLDVEEKR